MLPSLREWLHHRRQEGAQDSQASGSFQNLGDTIAMVVVKQDKEFLGWITSTQPLVSGPFKQGHETGC